MTDAVIPKDSIIRLCDEHIIRKSCHSPPPTPGKPHVDLKQRKKSKSRRLLVPIPLGNDTDTYDPNINRKQVILFPNEEIPKRYQKIRCTNYRCKKTYCLATARKCNNLIYISIDDEYTPCRGYFCPHCYTNHRDDGLFYCNNWTARCGILFKSNYQNELSNLGGLLEKSKPQKEEGWN